jgi:hypothetical protein
MKTTGPALLIDDFKLRQWEAKEWDYRKSQFLSQAFGRITHQHFNESHSVSCQLV